MEDNAATVLLNTRRDNRVDYKKAETPLAAKNSYFVVTMLPEMCNWEIGGFFKDVIVTI